MSVFTVVAENTLRDWLVQYDLQLVAFEGITSGITNTNYFVDTTKGRFVLTLFEVLKLDELPFYLKLMRHLAHQGVACAAPLSDRQHRLASVLAGRAACIVPRLEGQEVESPNPAQCYAIGSMLAKLHHAAKSFPSVISNPRGATWCAQTASTLYPLISADDHLILRREIHYQAQHRFNHLPHGIIHADLFKDNVLMHGEAVAGFIDFYYACHGVLIYDVAIALNDWARKSDGQISDEHADALLQGYQTIRPFEATEITAWPALLRAAALRFWISRLQDLHHPMTSTLTYRKDPTVFRELLITHRKRHNFWVTQPAK